MTELRTFVGHSFKDDDKALVGIFCDHFDNLAKANLNFSWDHAVGAEPSPLSQKVLAKIEGKNVFIGICTKSERAIGDSFLRPALLRKHLQLAERDKFEWKTSDWIIQEIGLAVGRKMSVIIFLEEGVREPGGLYGNIEYIPFSRANPQASFDKLLQMLTSLSPKEPVGSTANAESPPSEKAKLTEAQSSDLVPKPDWSADQYNSAMVSVVLQEDAVALDRISEAFRGSKHSTGLGASEWEGRIEWLRVIFWKGGDFEKLKRLAAENPASSRLQMFLARGYDEFGDHTKAAEIFQKASRAAENETQQAAFDSDAALQYARAGETARALALFEQAKRVAKDQPTAFETITGDLRTLAQIEKNDELELAALEHGVDLCPGDWKLRFQLAYKHSQSGNNDMAFYHYIKIPSPLRDSTTWNNLGVSFLDFAMPAKGIGAFRRAEELLDTLAMTNIGFRLLRSGFIDEASQLVKKAMSVETYHSNVAHLLKQLKETPEEEDQKETEALEKTRPKAAFYRQLGTAALGEAPIRMGSRWQAPEGILDASLDGADVRIFGSYEQEENSLGGLLGGLSRQKVTRRIQYTLKLRGEMLVGEIKRMTDGVAPASIVALGLGSEKVVMYFYADRTELCVMEGSRFYSLKCVD
jgi:tetratricopeptide (TPR) repeat protein